MTTTDTVVGLDGDVLADVVLLNRAVYGGDDALPPAFRDDYDPARDPSDAGIRDDLNAYDRYDLYLAQFGLTTLGAEELGFGPADSSTSDDLLPGDGNGIDQNWFYAGDLYRNHVVEQPGQPDAVYADAAAVGLVSTRETEAGTTLHLTFRGTDADLGKDGEAGTAEGQARYFGQLTPLIEAAYAYAADPANGITDVVVSGHSLGGAMADLFALYYGAEFDALPGVDLQVVSLASAGVDPGVLALRPDYDPALVDLGPDGATLVTPDWYASYDHSEDIVRNPDAYSYAEHRAADPQQAPITFVATRTLTEHLHFEDNRLKVEVPLLDQYAVGAGLESTFLPQHDSTLYEMIGADMAASLELANTMDLDRIVALGGRSGALEGVAGANNVNAFGLPEDNVWAAPDDGRAVWVLGLSGEDSIAGAGGSDLLDGGVGDDRLDGGGGRDALMGQAGSDLLHGGVNGDDLQGVGGRDRLFGEGGADGLKGGSGNDRLDGGAGDDVLKGGGGNDNLAGGEGADVFVFAGDWGRDAVADFGVGDRLDLTGFRQANGGEKLTLDDLLLTETDAGTRLRLDLDRDGRADALDLDGDGATDDGSVMLRGVSAADLDAGDFLF